MAGSGHPLSLCNYVSGLHSKVISLPVLPICPNTSKVSELLNILCKLFLTGVQIQACSFQIAGLFAKLTQ